MTKLPRSLDEIRGLLARGIPGTARPFGGLVDDLLNEVLGLKTGIEEFLLAVAVGHPVTDVPPQTRDRE